MSLAPIYIDEQGRRRVDREGPSEGAAAGNQQDTGVAELKAQVQSLTAKISALESKVEGMTIAGTGFSGSGPNGIQFDENALSTLKGDQGDKGDTGDKGDKGEKGERGPAAVVNVTAECQEDGTIDITATTSDE
jgi:hypothetical protein